jgi:hypothetical protein
MAEYAGLKFEVVTDPPEPDGDYGAAVVQGMWSSPSGFGPRADVTAEQFCDPPGQQID